MKLLSFYEYESYSNDSYDSDQVDETPEKQKSILFEDIFYKLRGDFLEYCNSRFNVPVICSDVLDSLEEYINFNNWKEREDWEEYD